ncbi:MAG: hypothetical protein LQ340_008027, partial [Diploschistes diacapsis]
MALAKSQSQSQSQSSSQSSSSTSSSSQNPSPTTATSSSLFPPLAQRPDCPPDVDALGRSTWTLLHSIAAGYPSRATSPQQSEMTQFLSLFSKLYPCWVCAEDFQAWMSREKPR